MPEIKNLKQQILEKVKGKKPVSKKYFLVTSFLIIVLILFLTVLAGVLFGFFAWDSLQFLDGEFLHWLFLITLVLFVTIFLIYRKTDFC
jgi:hypothetical protein